MAVVWGCLAQLYERTQALPAAVNALGKAAALDPQPARFKQLADMNAAHGDHAACASALTKVYEIAKSKNNTEKLLEIGSLIATAHTKANNPDKARAHLTSHLLLVGPTLLSHDKKLLVLLTDVLTQRRQCTSGVTTMANNNNNNNNSLGTTSTSTSSSSNSSSSSSSSKATGSSLTEAKKALASA